MRTGLCDNSGSGVNTRAEFAPWPRPSQTRANYKRSTMGVRAQLRSVVQWVDADPEILFERWTDNGDEIKNASKLIVGPGQGCIFVYEGAIRATLTKEGIVEV